MYAYIDSSVLASRVFWDIYPILTPLPILTFSPTADNFPKIVLIRVVYPLPLPPDIINLAPNGITKFIFGV